MKDREKFQKAKEDIPEPWAQFLVSVSPKRPRIEVGSSKTVLKTIN